MAHLVALNTTIIHPPALKLQSFGEIKMRILLALRAYMRSGVCVTVESPFVCFSQHSTPAAACGGFAAVGDSLSIDSDGSERPTAKAPQHGTAVRRSAANSGSAMSTAELTNDAELKRLVRI